MRVIVYPGIVLAHEILLLYIGVLRKRSLVHVHIHIYSYGNISSRRRACANVRKSSTWSIITLYSFQDGERSNLRNTWVRWAKKTCSLLALRQPIFTASNPSSCCCEMNSKRLYSASVHLKRRLRLTAIVFRFKCRRTDDIDWSRQSQIRASVLCSGTHSLCAYLSVMMVEKVEVVEKDGLVDKGRCEGSWGTMKVKRICRTHKSGLCWYTRQSSATVYTPPNFAAASTLDCECAHNFVRQSCENIGDCIWSM